MRKSTLEKLRDSRQVRSAPIETDLMGLAELMADGRREKDGRKLNPTQWSFICEAEQDAAYMGPAGCAKTTTLAEIGMLRSLTMSGSRGLVGRLDYNDLADTTKGRMEEMLGRLPKGTLLDRDKSIPEKWYIRPIDDGEPSQITFMGLKEEMGSYEFNWAIVDEADEVAEKVILSLQGRLRLARKGAPLNEEGQVMKGCGEYALRLAFNPPDKNHWLYTACTGRDFQERFVKQPWLKLYRPQPKENVRNLKENYYEDRAKSLPEDMIQRLIQGEWGTTHPGSPVYRQFKRAVHGRSELPFDPHRTLFRFWDFGYNRPACIWAQLDWEGRLLCLRELLGEKKEVTEFARDVKGETARWFPNAREITDFGDPAGDQHKDTGKTLWKLKQQGITIFFQRSEVKVGLDLIRERLNLLIDGEPAMQFSTSGCPILCSAMGGGYHMDDKGEKPVKDGYYDHECDALRYGCINLLGSGGTLLANATTSDLPDSVAYDPNFDTMMRG